MTWSYRVVKEECQGSISGEIFVIKEAQYDKDKKTPHSLTIGAIHPQGETLEDLKEDFDLMLKAFNKSVLEDKKYDNA